MPNKPQRICSQPGCRELTHGRFCSFHQAQADKHYNRVQRNRDAQKYYDSPEHRRQRQMKLSRDPFCEECRRNGKFTEATVADHITPLSQGGPKTLENLQSLCASCHSSKSAREGSRWGKTGR